MLDRDLLSELQLTLIEPPDGGDSWPSLIWERSEVLDAIDAAIRQLARAVHLDVARTEILVAVPAASTLPLPPDWLATAALVWRDLATQTRTPLGPADAFEADLALPGWEATPALPLAYRDLEGDTLTLQLVPPPAASGVVELLYIRVPPAVTATAPGAALPLAEEFTSGVKYGALGTLLRKVGRLLDPERASYCERRVELTRTAADILLHGWA